MPERRHMKLGAFMRPVGFHNAWWRYPGGYPDANFSWQHLSRFARQLEAAKFDIFFTADQLALMNVPIDALKRSATVTSFDPHTLISAVAAITERIGLVATASTTYDHPFHVARRFAALDHLSGGRAGWNVVTTENPDTAANFGMEHHPEHSDRYDRAREFFSVVTGLWDSWADNAFVRNVETGEYFDPARLHVLDHKGPNLSVRGPLNVARPVQGWPVIVQAGASDAGRAFAAEHAELIFTAQNALEDGVAFSADLRARATRVGRDPRHLIIMPACFVVVGDTVHQARAKRALLDSLVSADSATAALSIALGHDASRYDPDAQLPDVPESNNSKSSRQRAIDLANREGLTVRQLGQRLAGYGALSMVGTAITIADEMETWFESGGCDGFMILFSDLPQGLNDFVDKVVPELRRRGLFKTEYRGNTLREHLDLPRPANRFFEA